jgi:hypothetical protein
MPLSRVAGSPRMVHEKAVDRLRAARRKLSRARRTRAEAIGTPDEHDAVAAASGAGADVAMRQEWLHWVDEGRSTRPEADGEWGFAADAATRSAGELPRTIHRCECGRLLRVFGGGRHRVFFEPGDVALADPVLTGVCAGCGRRLPGKNRA